MFRSTALERGSYFPARVCTARNDVALCGLTATSCRRAIWFPGPPAPWVAVREVLAISRGNMCQRGLSSLSHRVFPTRVSCSSPLTVALRARHARRLVGRLCANVCVRAFHSGGLQAAARAARGRWPKACDGKFARARSRWTCAELRARAPVVRVLYEGYPFKRSWRESQWAVDHSQKRGNCTRPPSFVDVFRAGGLKPAKTMINPAR